MDAFDARLMRNIIDGRVDEYRGRIVDIEERLSNQQVNATYEDQDKKNKAAKVKLVVSKYATIFLERIIK